MGKAFNEASLECALEDLYQQWSQMGFWARRLHQKFSPGRARYVGGVAAVRSVLRSKTGGFAFLKERDQLSLSVEYLILKPEWKHLFCDEDRDLARKRLGRISQ
jgi:hypothetical protein